MAIWHGSLDRAEAILAAHPEIASSDIHTAAILGDDAGGAAVPRGSIRRAPRRKAGPHGWDALTHLCFSNIFALDPARSDGFVRAATALLDAGASANTGFYERTTSPSPSGRACSTAPPAWRTTPS